MRLPIFPNCPWGGTTDLPPRGPWGTNIPSPITDGEHVFGHSLGPSPQASTAREETTPVISHPTTPMAPTPSSGVKQWCHLPDQVACPPHPGDEVVETSEELPCQKWKDRMPFKKLLKGGQQEAFAKDSDLVQQAREAYFRTNHPDFSHKVLHDLSHTFWEVVDSASLLESGIYEVWDAWTGQKDLHSANHTAKASQKNIFSQKNV